MKEEMKEVMADAILVNNVLSTDIAVNSEVANKLFLNLHVLIILQEIAMNQSTFMVQENVKIMKMIVLLEEFVLKVFVITLHHHAMLKELLDVLNKNHVLEQ